MPMFEYKCLGCGAVTAIAEQSESARIASRKCGSCGGRKLKRVMSSFVYNPPVTLEDLGVNIVNQPQSQYPAQPQGPPPGGCPYEKMEKEAEEKKKKELENPTFFL